MRDRYDFSKSTQNPYANRKKDSRAQLEELLGVDADDNLKLTSYEGDRLEYKEGFTWSYRAMYARTLAAFANNKGGFIVFGVEDESRKIVGMKNDDFENIDPAEITQYLNSAFEPALEWEKIDYKCSGLKLGVLSVKSSRGKPVFCKRNDGRYLKDREIYYRYAARTERIQRAEYQEITNQNLNNIGGIENRATDAAAEREGRQLPKNRISAGVSEQTGGSRRLSDSFVLNPTAKSLPADLCPTDQKMLHRDNVVQALFDFWSRRQSEGVLVWLSGPPRSGRTTVLQHFSRTVADDREAEGSTAILHLQLGTSQRPIRTFYRAMSDAEVSSRHPAYGDSNDEDEDEGNTFRSLFDSRIPGLPGQCKLIVIMEDFDEIVHDDIQVGELRTILNSVPLRSSFILLESYGKGLSTQGNLHNLVNLPPFDAVQAQDLLVAEGQPEERAAGAIEKLTAHADQFFHPGILKQGAIQHDPAFADLLGEEPTAEDLALSIMEEASDLAREIVERCCKAEDCEAGASLRSLMAMSVFSKADICAKTLKAAGLEPIPGNHLRRIRWLGDGLSNCTNLMGFGRDAMRELTARTLSDEYSHGSNNRHNLLAAIKSLTEVLFDSHAQGERPLADILDEAVAWLRRRVPEESDLISEFQALLISESAGDSVLPVPMEEEQSTAESLFDIGKDQSNMDAAIAALTLYSRPGIDSGIESFVQQRDKFLESLDSVSALVDAGSALNPRQLTAYDTAMYFGCRRFHQFDRGLSARKKLYDAQFAEDGGARVRPDEVMGRASLSFLMNLADASLSLGNVAEAKKYADHAGRRLATELNCPTDSHFRWLSARFRLLQARLTTDPARCLENLTGAAECVELTPEDSRGTHFYLRIVRRLVEADGDESGRRQHVERARERLKENLGPSEDWALSILVPFAALMREEASRSWDSDYQSKRAKEALGLFRARDGGRMREDIRLNPQASLVLARIQAFLGDESGALANCEAAMALNPTAATWLFRLRLLDDPGSAKQDWHGDAEFGGTTSPISRPLREAIKNLQTFIKGHDLSSPPYGRVMLWVTQRKWRSEGSLDRAVARQLKERDIDYKSLPIAERQRHLNILFNRRSRQIDGIKNRFGPMIPLVMADFGNTAQYIRSSAVLTGNPPDTTAAMAILDAGLKQWPNNHFLTFQKSEYQRYLWNQETAIVGFRKLRSSASDGVLRRRASVALVRSLHSAAVYSEDFIESKREDFLEEAQSVLSDLSGSFDDAIELAILKDHVALESGQSVDWSTMDEMHEKIVGNVTGFPNTLIANYKNIYGLKDQAPISTSEALQHDFTNPEILGLAGFLYLRRAEKKIGNRVLEDYECAIGYFLAQSMMEKAAHGHELPTTSFRIGRAILSAAESFQRVNPIGGLSIDDRRRDQLAEAEAKFSSVVSRSAGQFRDKARENQSHAAQVRAGFLRDAAAKRAGE